MLKKAFISFNYSYRNLFSPTIWGFINSFWNNNVIKKRKTKFKLTFESTKSCLSSLDETKWVRFEWSIDKAVNGSGNDIFLILLSIWN